MNFDANNMTQDKNIVPFPDGVFSEEDEKPKLGFFGEEYKEAILNEIYNRDRMRNMARDLLRLLERTPLSIRKTRSFTNQFLLEFKLFEFYIAEVHKKKKKFPQTRWIFMLLRRYFAHEWQVSNFNQTKFKPTILLHRLLGFVESYMPEREVKSKVFLLHIITSAYHLYRLPHWYWESCANAITSQLQVTEEVQKLDRSKPILIDDVWFNDKLSDLIQADEYCTDSDDSDDCGVNCISNDLAQRVVAIIEIDDDSDEPDDDIVLVKDRNKSVVETSTATTKEVLFTKRDRDFVQNGSKGPASMRNQYSMHRRSNFSRDPPVKNGKELVKISSALICVDEIEISDDDSEELQIKCEAVSICENVVEEYSIKDEDREVVVTKRDGEFVQNGNKGPTPTRNEYSVQGRSNFTTDPPIKNGKEPVKKSSEYSGKIECSEPDITVTLAPSVITSSGNSLPENVSQNKVQQQLSKVETIIIDCADSNSSGKEISDLVLTSSVATAGPQTTANRQPLLDNADGAVIAPTPIKKTASLNVINNIEDGRIKTSNTPSIQIGVNNTSLNVINAEFEHDKKSDTPSIHVDEKIISNNNVGNHPNKIYNTQSFSTTRAKPPLLYASESLKNENVEECVSSKVDAKSLVYQDSSSNMSESKSSPKNISKHLLDECGNSTKMTENKVNTESQTIPIFPVLTREISESETFSLQTSEFATMNKGMSEFSTLIQNTKTIDQDIDYSTTISTNSTNEPSSIYSDQIETKTYMDNDKNITTKTKDIRNNLISSMKTDEQLKEDNHYEVIKKEQAYAKLDEHHDRKPTNLCNDSCLPLDVNVKLEVVEDICFEKSPCVDALCDTRKDVPSNIVHIAAGFSEVLDSHKMRDTDCKTFMKVPFLPELVSRSETISSFQQIHDVKSEETVLITNIENVPTDNTCFPTGQEDNNCLDEFVQKESNQNKSIITETSVEGKLTGDLIPNSTETEALQFSETMQKIPNIAVVETILTINDGITEIVNDRSSQPVPNASLKDKSPSDHVKSNLCESIKDKPSESLQDKVTELIQDKPTLSIMDKPNELIKDKLIESIESKPIKSINDKQTELIQNKPTESTKDKLLESLELQPTKLIENYAIVSVKDANIKSVSRKNKSLKDKPVKSVTGGSIDEPDRLLKNEPTKSIHDETTESVVGRPTETSKGKTTKVKGMPTPSQRDILTDLMQDKSTVDAKYNKAERDRPTKQDISTAPVQNETTESLNDLSSKSTIDESTKSVNDLSNISATEVSTESINYVFNKSVTDDLTESAKQVYNKSITDEPSELVIDMPTKQDISTAPVQNETTESLNDLSNKSTTDESTKSVNDLSNISETEVSTESINYVFNKSVTDDHTESVKQVYNKSITDEPTELVIDMSSKSVIDEPIRSVKTKSASVNNNSLKDKPTKSVKDASTESVIDAPSESVKGASTESVNEKYTESVKNKLVNDKSSKAEETKNTESVKDVSTELFHVRSKKLVKDTTNKRLFGSGFSILQHAESVKADKNHKCFSAKKDKPPVSVQDISTKALEVTKSITDRSTDSVTDRNSECLKKKIVTKQSTKSTKDRTTQSAKDKPTKAICKMSSVSVNDNSSESLQNKKPIESVIDCPTKLIIGEPTETVEDEFTESVRDKSTKSLTDKSSEYIRNNSAENDKLVKDNAAKLVVKEILQSQKIKSTESVKYNCTEPRLDQATELVEDGPSETANDESAISVTDNFTATIKDGFTKLVKVTHTESVKDIFTDLGKDRSAVKDKLVNAKLAKSDEGKTSHAQKIIKSTNTLTEPLKYEELIPAKPTRFLKDTCHTLGNEPILSVKYNSNKSEIDKSAGLINRNSTSSILDKGTKSVNYTSGEPLGNEPTKSVKQTLHISGVDNHEIHNPTDSVPDKPIVLVENTLQELLDKSKSGLGTSNKCDEDQNYTGIPIQLVKNKSTEFIKDNPAETMQCKPTDIMHFKSTETKQYKTNETIQHKTTEQFKDSSNESLMNEPTEFIKNESTESIKDESVMDETTEAAEDKCTKSVKVNKNTKSIKDKLVPVENKPAQLMEIPAKSLEDAPIQSLKAKPIKPLKDVLPTESVKALTRTAQEKPTELHTSTEIIKYKSNKLLVGRITTSVLEDSAKYVHTKPSKNKSAKLVTVTIPKSLNDITTEPVQDNTTEYVEDKTTERVKHKMIDYVGDKTTKFVIDKTIETVKDESTEISNNMHTPVKTRSTETVQEVTIESFTDIATESVKENTAELIINKTTESIMDKTSVSLTESVKGETMELIQENTTMSVNDKITGLGKDGATESLNYNLINEHPTTRSTNKCSVSSTLTAVKPLTALPQSLKQKPAKSYQAEPVEKFYEELAELHRDKSGNGIFSQQHHENISNADQEKPTDLDAQLNIDKAVIHKVIITQVDGNSGLLGNNLPIQKIENNEILENTVANELNLNHESTATGNEDVQSIKCKNKQITKKMDPIHAKKSVPKSGKKVARYDEPLDTTIVATSDRCFSRKHKALEKRRQLRKCILTKTESCKIKSGDCPQGKVPYQLSKSTGCNAGTFDATSGKSLSRSDFDQEDGHMTKSTSMESESYVNTFNNKISTNGFKQEGCQISKSSTIDSTEITDTCNEISTVEDRLMPVQQKECRPKKSRVQSSNRTQRKLKNTEIINHVKSQNKEDLATPIKQSDEVLKTTDTCNEISTTEDRPMPVQEQECRPKKSRVQSSNRNKRTFKNTETMNHVKSHNKEDHATQIKRSDELLNAEASKAGDPFNKVLKPEGAIEKCLKPSTGKSNQKDCFNVSTSLIAINNSHNTVDNNCNASSNGKDVLLASELTDRENCLNSNINTEDLCDLTNSLEKQITECQDSSSTIAANFVKTVPESSGDPRTLMCANIDVSAQALDSHFQTLSEIERTIDCDGKQRDELLGHQLSDACKNLKNIAANKSKIGENSNDLVQPIVSDTVPFISVMVKTVEIVDKSSNIIENNQTNKTNISDYISTKKDEMINVVKPKIGIGNHNLLPENDVTSVYVSITDISESTDLNSKYCKDGTIVLKNDFNEQSNKVSCEPKSSKHSYDADLQHQDRSISSVVLEQHKDNNVVDKVHENFEVISDISSQSFIQKESESVVIPNKDHANIETAELKIPSISIEHLEKDSTSPDIVSRDDVSTVPDVLAVEEVGCEITVISSINDFSKEYIKLKDNQQESKSESRYKLAIQDDSVIKFTVPTEKFTSGDGNKECPEVVAAEVEVNTSTHMFDGHFDSSESLPNENRTTIPIPSSVTLTDVPKFMNTAETKEQSQFEINIIPLPIGPEPMHPEKREIMDYFELELHNLDLLAAQAESRVETDKRSRFKLGNQLEAKKYLSKMKKEVKQSKSLRKLKSKPISTENQDNKRITRSCSKSQKPNSVSMKVNDQHEYWNISENYVSVEACSPIECDVVALDNVLSKQETALSKKSSDKTTQLKCKKSLFPNEHSKKSKPVQENLAFQSKDKTAGSKKKVRKSKTSGDSIKKIVINESPADLHDNIVHKKIPQKIFLDTVTSTDDSSDSCEGKLIIPDENSQIETIINDKQKKRKENVQKEIKIPAPIQFKKMCDLTIQPEPVPAVIDASIVLQDFSKTNHRIEYILASNHVSKTIEEVVDNAAFVEEKPQIRTKAQLKSYLKMTNTFKDQEECLEVKEVSKDVSFRVSRSKSCDVKNLPESSAQRRASIETSIKKLDINKLPYSVSNLLKSDNKIHSFEFSGTSEEQIGNNVEFETGSTTTEFKSKTIFDEVFSNKDENTELVSKTNMKPWKKRWEMLNRAETQVKSDVPKNHDIALKTSSIDENTTATPGSCLVPPCHSGEALNYEKSSQEKSVIEEVVASDTFMESNLNTQLAENLDLTVIGDTGKNKNSLASTAFTELLDNSTDEATILKTKSDTTSLAVPAQLQIMETQTILSNNEPQVSSAAAAYKLKLDETVSRLKGKLFAEGKQKEVIEPKSTEVILKSTEGISKSAIRIEHDKVNEEMVVFHELPRSSKSSHQSEIADNNKLPHSATNLEKTDTSVHDILVVSEDTLKLSELIQRKKSDQYDSTKKFATAEGDFGKQAGDAAIVKVKGIIETDVAKREQDEGKLPNFDVNAILDNLETKSNLLTENSKGLPVKRVEDLEIENRSKNALAEPKTLSNIVTSDNNSVVLDPVLISKDDVEEFIEEKIEVLKDKVAKGQCKSDSEKIKTESKKKEVTEKGLCDKYLKKVNESCEINNLESMKKSKGSIGRIKEDCKLKRDPELDNKKDPKGITTLDKEVNSLPKDVEIPSAKSIPNHKDSRSQTKEVINATTFNDKTVSIGVKEKLKDIKLSDKKMYDICEGNKTNDGSRMPQLKVVIKKLNVKDTLTEIQKKAEKTSSALDKERKLIISKSKEVEEIKVKLVDSKVIKKQVRSSSVDKAKLKDHKKVKEIDHKTNNNKRDHEKNKRLYRSKSVDKNRLEIKKEKSCDRADKKDEFGDSHDRSNSSKTSKVVNEEKCDTKLNAKCETEPVNTTKIREGNIKKTNDKISSKSIETDQKHDHTSSYKSRNYRSTRDKREDKLRSGKYNMDADKQVDKKTHPEDKSRKLKEGLAHRTRSKSRDDFRKVKSHVEAVDTLKRKRIDDDLESGVEVNRPNKKQDTKMQTDAKLDTKGTEETTKLIKQCRQSKHHAKDNMVPQTQLKVNQDMADKNSNDGNIQTMKDEWLNSKKVDKEGNKTKPAKSTSIEPFEKVHDCSSKNNKVFKSETRKGLEKQSPQQLLDEIKFKGVNIEKNIVELTMPSEINTNLQEIASESLVKNQMKQIEEAPEIKSEITKIGKVDKVQVVKSFDLVQVVKADESPEVHTEKKLDLKNIDKEVIKPDCIYDEQEMLKKASQKNSLQDTKSKIKHILKDHQDVKTTLQLEIIANDCDSSSFLGALTNSSCKSVDTKLEKQKVVKDINQLQELESKAKEVVKNEEHQHEIKGNGDDNNLHIKTKPKLCDEIIKIQETQHEMPKVETSIKSKVVILQDVQLPNKATNVDTMNGDTILKDDLNAVQSGDFTKVPPSFINACNLTEAQEKKRLPVLAGEHSREVKRKRWDESTCKSSVENKLFSSDAKNIHKNKKDLSIKERSTNIEEIINSLMESNKISNPNKINKNAEITITCQTKTLDFEAQTPIKECTITNQEMVCKLDKKENVANILCPGIQEVQHTSKSESAKIDTALPHSAEIKLKLKKASEIDSKNCGVEQKEILKYDNANVNVIVNKAARALDVVKMITDDFNDDLEDHTMPEQNMPILKTIEDSLISPEVVTKNAIENLQRISKQTKPPNVIVERIPIKHHEVAQLEPLVTSDLIDSPCTDMQVTIDQPLVPEVLQAFITKGKTAMYMSSENLIPAQPLPVISASETIDTVLAPTATGLGIVSKINTNQLLAPDMTVCTQINTPELGCVPDLHVSNPPQSSKPGFTNADVDDTPLSEKVIAIGSYQVTIGSSEPTSGIGGPFLNEQVSIKPLGKKIGDKLEGSRKDLDESPVDENIIFPFSEQVCLENNLVPIESVSLDNSAVDSTTDYQFSEQDSHLGFGFIENALPEDECLIDPNTSENMFIPNICKEETIELDEDAVNEFSCEEASPQLPDVFISDNDNQRREEFMLGNMSTEQMNEIMTHQSISEPPHDNFKDAFNLDISQQQNVNSLPVTNRIDNKTSSFEYNLGIPGQAIDLVQGNSITGGTDTISNVNYKSEFPQPSAVLGSNVGVSNNNSFPMSGMSLTDLESFEYNNCSKESSAPIWSQEFVMRNKQLNWAPEALCKMELMSETVNDIGKLRQLDENIFQTPKTTPAAHESHITPDTSIKNSEIFNEIPEVQEEPKPKKTTTPKSNKKSPKQTQRPLTRFNVINIQKLRSDNQPKIEPEAAAIAVRTYDRSKVCAPIKPKNSNQNSEQGKSSDSASSSRSTKTKQNEEKTNLEAVGTPEQLQNLQSTSKHKKKPSFVSINDSDSTKSKNGEKRKLPQLEVNGDGVPAKRPKCDHKDEDNSFPGGMKKPEPTMDEVFERLRNSDVNSLPILNSCIADDCRTTKPINSYNFNNESLRRATAQTKKIDFREAAKEKCRRNIFDPEEVSSNFEKEVKNIPLHHKSIAKTTDRRYPSPCYTPTNISHYTSTTKSQKTKRVTSPAGPLRTQANCSPSVTKSMHTRQSSSADRSGVIPDINILKPIASNKHDTPYMKMHTRQSAASADRPAMTPDVKVLKPIPPNKHGTPHMKATSAKQRQHSSNSPCNASLPSDKYKHHNEQLGRPHFAAASFQRSSNSEGLRRRYDDHSTGSRNSYSGSTSRQQKSVNYGGVSSIDSRRHTDGVSGTYQGLDPNSGRSQERNRPTYYPDILPSNRRQGPFYVTSLSPYENRSSNNADWRKPISNILPEPEVSFNSPPDSDIEESRN